MSNEWIRNTGEIPVRKGTLVDVKHHSTKVYTKQAAGVEGYAHQWFLSGGSSDIAFWRPSQEEKSLEDAFDEPDSVPWMEATTYHLGEKIVYKYPETKPAIVKKSIEQLAIDVLYNTTGKSYTEREIVAIVSIVDSIKELENV